MSTNNKWEVITACFILFLDTKQKRKAGRKKGHIIISGIGSCGIHIFWLKAFFQFKFTVELITKQESNKIKFILVH